MDELNKFSKRFKRYANLGTSAGSLAINFLGSKIFLTLKMEKMQKIYLGF